MIHEFKKAISYYFWATYRRKILDRLLEENKHYYKGIVLDIGGRDRGRFEKPKDKVEKWVFADIVEKHKPDIVLDITDMASINDKSIDVINAIETFEHVEKPEKGLRECHRVLADKGVMIMSVPFIFPIHADPYDFQRWTRDKWKKELEASGFMIEKLEEMGYFFTVMMDMIITLIKELPSWIRRVCKLTYPLMSLLAKLDECGIVRKNDRLNKYTTGYYMILRKEYGNG